MAQQKKDDFLKSVSEDEKSIKPAVEGLKKSGMAKVALILGFLSFIPGLGFYIGIVGLIFGFISLSQIKRDGLGGKKMANGGIALCILGILFTFVVYGLLFYWGGVAKNGPFVKIKVQLTDQILTQNIGILEMYKKQNGSYPQNLEQMTNEGFSVYPVDAYSNPLIYKLAADGQAYEILSTGADGEYGTADDIFPSGKLNGSNSVEIEANLP